MARMEDKRPPKCVMFDEQLKGGAGCVGGQGKEWMGCSWTISDLSVSTPTIECRPGRGGMG